jgi:hypothetical protein
MANDRRSLRRLKLHTQSLETFRGAYEAYLDATAYGVVDASADEEQKLRRAVTTALPAADQALTVAGMVPSQTPPPSVGGMILRGLANTAFMHEQLPLGGQGTPQFLLDTVDGAIARIDTFRREEQRRRWNPFYWIDRVLREVLGIPAYLLGLIVGVPVSRIEGSVWAAPLRLVGLAVELALLFVGGRELGWW